jgi:hypothetical protein
MSTLTLINKSNLLYIQSFCLKRAHDFYIHEENYQGSMKNEEGA